MKYTISLDRNEDGVWIALCPIIPGCVSQGSTRANFKMVDRFYQPFASNTSRNKGVLHTLVANCPKQFVDNLCAIRPREQAVENIEDAIRGCLEVRSELGYAILETA